MTLTSWFLLQQDRCRRLACSGGRIAYFHYGRPGNTGVCLSIWTEMRNPRMIEQRLNSLAQLKGMAARAGEPKEELL